MIVHDGGYEPYDRPIRAYDTSLSTPSDTPTPARPSENITVQESAFWIGGIWALFGLLNESEDAVKRYGKRVRKAEKAAKRAFRSHKRHKNSKRK